jgi:hypothetical protein
VRALSTDPSERLRETLRKSKVRARPRPRWLRSAKEEALTEQSTEPVSLERARLLLGWLQAQRAVDRCLSELLAAGPAGERRVSRDIDHVSQLVALAAKSFEAYRDCVQESHPPQPAPSLHSVS